VSCDLKINKKNQYIFIHCTDGYWVGGSDAGQLPGHFLWPGGRQVDEALWASGQPDGFGSGKEMCVWIHSDNGKLFDHPCNGNDCYFICELAKKDQLCL